jgi:hypothetical protein
MIKALDVYSTVEYLRLKLTGKKVNKKSMYFKFQKTNATIKSIASNIASRVNSSHYSLRDLECYIYFYYIHNDENIWFKIKHDEVNECEKKYFSKISLQNDKKIILEVNKTTKFNNIADYFAINEDGENYASLLIFNKYISPSFYMRYMGYQKTDKKENKRQNKLTQVMQVIKGEITNG